LINFGTLQLLAYVSGIVLAFGAIRAMRVPPEMETASLTRAARTTDWRKSVPTLRNTAEWLLANRKVGAMLLVGSIVVALFDGLNTLMPVYVRDVRNTSNPILTSDRRMSAGRAASRPMRQPLRHPRPPGIDVRMQEVFDRATLFAVRHWYLATVPDCADFLTPPLIVGARHSLIRLLPRQRARSQRADLRYLDEREGVDKPATIARDNDQKDRHHPTGDQRCGHCDHGADRTGISVG
jgi:hypothetical protein